MTLEIFARPDLEGRLLPMIRTLGGYARDSGRIDATEVDRAILLLEEALAAKRYLVLAPQFVVAATK